jgi:hypothetical protein
MPWEVIILPVIAVAVWIIGTLIRGAEKAQGPDGAPPRKAERVTDLDRFLREVHRRRQMGDRAEERPEPSERRREPEPPPVRRPAPRQEEIPVVLPVQEVVRAEPVAPAPALRVIAAPPLPDVPSDKSDRPPAQRPELTALGSLRRLLQSREGMRTAMILREVLGPPLSRRRRP